MFDSICFPHNEFPVKGIVHLLMPFPVSFPQDGIIPQNGHCTFSMAYNSRLDWFLSKILKSS
jgi:hypothetical protein